MDYAPRAYGAPLPFLLLLSLLHAADKPRTPDSKVGWKDLRWGVSLPEELTCQSPRPGMKVCERKASDDKRVGDLQVDKVVLIFWNDRFAESHVTASGSETCDVLLAGLETAYGEGEGDPRHRDWEGDRIRIVWDLNDAGTQCALKYAYRPILDEILDERRRALSDRARAAANDL